MEFNSIEERNKSIAYYLAINGLYPGVPNWWVDVCSLYNVTYDIVKGVHRRYKRDIEIEEAKHKFRLSQIQNEGNDPLISNKSYGTNHDMASMYSKREVTEDFAKGTQVINVTTDIEIKTVDDLIRVCEIDTENYNIVKSKFGTWGSNKDRKYSVSVETSLKKQDTSTLFESLLEDFKKAVKNVSPKYIKKEQFHVGKTVIVPLTDIHIGMSIDENSLYGGIYDANRALERFKEITDYIVEMYSDYGRFNKLYILNLGDDLDGAGGQTTRGGHKLPQNLNTKGQFLTFLDVFKYLFDVLIEENLANEIEYIVTTNANHSSEFSFIANKSLEIYLNAKYPQIQVTISERFINHFYVNEDTCYLYCHGKDDKDMKYGLPLILNDKTEKYINRYLDHYGIDVPNITFLKGDLHQSATAFADRFRYRNLPAVAPSSGWVQVNFGEIDRRSGVDIDVIDSSSNLIEHKLRF